MTAPTGSDRAPAGSKSDLASLARGGSLNLIGAGVSAVLNTLLLVLVTRGIDRAEAGVFFVTTSLFLIVTTAATVGVDTGVLRFIPRYRALRRHQEIPQILWFALAPVAVLGTVLAIALHFTAPTIGRVAVGADRAGEFVEVLRVLAPFVPLVVVYNIVLAATRGYVTMRPTVFIERIGRSILQCGAVAVALLHPSLTTLSLAWVVPYSVAIIASAVWLLGLLRRPRERVTEPPSDEPQRPRPAGSKADRAASSGTFRDLWRFSALRGLARMFTVGLQRFDIVLVGALRGPADAAVYTAASRFLVLGTMAVQAIQQVMAPRMSELLAAEAHDRARTLYQTATGWLVSLSWPLYLSFAVFAPWFLGIFGSDYRAGEPVVVILCLAMLIACACGSVDSVLLMGGRSSWSLLNTSVAFATDVVIDLLLVPRIGIVGAAIGWAAALLVGNLMALGQVHFLMGMHPFGAGTRTAMVLCFWCYGLVPLHVRVPFGTGSIIVIGTLAVMTACYLAGLWRARGALGVEALGSLVQRKRRTGERMSGLSNAGAH